jgi:hypothetical protein
VLGSRFSLLFFDVLGIPALRHSSILRPEGPLC